MVKHVTDNDFMNEVVECGQLVLVDFWAAWCGHCKMMSPIFDELASEETDVKFVKLNVDENPSTAARYRVGSIPTLLAIKNGTVVDTIVGFRPKQELKAFVDKNK